MHSPLPRSAFLGASVLLASKTARERRDRSRADNRGQRVAAEKQAAPLAGDRESDQTRRLAQDSPPVILAPHFSSLTFTPPSERDEKRRGVGKAQRFGLHAGDRGVEQRALRVDDLELRHAAEPRLQADLVEIFLRGAFRDASLLDGACVR